MITKAIKIAIGAVLGLLVIWLVKPTELLSAEAIKYMGIFLAFVFWLLSSAMSDVAAALTAMSLLVIFKVCNFNAAFGQFSGNVVWTILTVFAVANAVNKTGLIRRIAFHIVKLFPPGYKGQVAAILTTGTLIVPLIPSTNAKAAILGPLAGNIIKEMGYKKNSNGAGGLFNALWIASGSNAHCWYTGSPNVLLMLGVLGAAYAERFNFGNWLLACSVGLILSLIFTYICIMIFYKPEEEKQIDRSFAENIIKDMGPMSAEEKFGAFVLGGMLILWCTTNLHHLQSSTVSTLGLLVLMFRGMVKPKDLCSLIPWNLVIWIGGIMGIAGTLNSVGLNTWLAEVLTPYLAPLVVNRYVCVIAVCIITYILRTFVNSPITVMTILYFCLGPVAESAGIGAFTVCMSCLFAGNCWHTYYNNPLLNAHMGSTNIGIGEDLLEYKDSVKMGWCFMVFTIICCLASVPLWQAMGL